MVVKHETNSLPIVKEILLQQRDDLSGEHPAQLPDFVAGAQGQEVCVTDAMIPIKKPLYARIHCLEQLSQIDASNLNSFQAAYVGLDFLEHEPPAQSDVNSRKRAVGSVHRPDDVQAPGQAERLLGVGQNRRQRFASACAL